ncbi:NAD(P)/FAD-dependent oxidoreductase [Ferrovibrio sp.]|uniref:NAD(P)/FAD-dependent oxidoreductase n=1 Tax=Ferrovibrio sp. TaxID=1917215 RepID=UPI0035AF3B0D
MKAIIVGGGIMGLSAAWALRNLGASVTLVEQGALPNPLGSSVDDHRLIRYPYGAARGYTRMVHAAYDAWEVLWRDLGVKLQIETGTLVLSGKDDNWAAQSRETLQAEGIQFEALEPAQLQAAYPFLDPDGIVEAFRCEHGGLLRAQAIIGSLKHWLLDHGIRLLSNQQVVAVDAEAGSVRLADGESLQADCVLVAAGPWTNRLLPELGDAARPSRQTVVYLEPPAEMVAAWYRAPMLLDIGGQSGFYAVPPRVCGDGMRLGLKIGDHSFGNTADPSADREPSQDEIDAILAPARRRLVGAEGYRVAQAKTCFYDVQPEEKFQFRRLGPRGYALCGSSGHGFKFGPVLGHSMAMAMTERAEMAEVARWISGEILAPNPNTPSSNTPGPNTPDHIIPVPASASDSKG